VNAPGPAALSGRLPRNNDFAAFSDPDPVESPEIDRAAIDVYVNVMEYEIPPRIEVSGPSIPPVQRETKSEGSGSNAETAFGHDDMPTSRGCGLAARSGRGGSDLVKQLT
jgi:hypothetical protein